jgi:CSLREA domain-containing protein
MTRRSFSAQHRIAVALAALVGFGILLEGSWRCISQASAARAPHSWATWLRQTETLAAPFATRTVDTIADDAAAATLTACTAAPNDCSLRGAISGAASGDTINFDEAVAFAIPTTILLSSELVINKNLTIDGPGADKLTVSGDATVRVFKVSGNNTIEIRDLKIANGNETDTDGGGIRAEGTGASPILTIRNCQITGNSSSRGGGLYIQGSQNVTVENSVFSNNSATSQGGGIFKNGTGTITVTGSRLENNTAVGATGGGLSDIGEGKVTLTNTKLIGNSAPHGGAFYSAHNPSGIIVEDTEFSGNSASDGGGGAYYFSTSVGSIAIHRSLFAGNTASTNGGGVLAGAGTAVTVTIASSTFTDNESNTQGGGIYTGGGTISAINLTIASNTASQGGGIYRASSGVVEFKNSLIANNTATGSGPDIGNAVGASFTSLGHNLIGKTDGGTITPVTGDQFGTIASPLDPLLGVLANNGGPTQTMALLTGSPALNTGDNTVTGAPASLTTDQRGSGFLRLQYSTVDIGAFEVQDPAIVVTTPANTIASDGQCSLREAINNANSDSQTCAGCSTDCKAGVGADTIVLAANTTYTLDVRDNTEYGFNGLPAITDTDPLVIEGNGATLTRSGAAPSFRLFYVAASGKLKLHNLTLHNGLTQGGSGNIGNAGSGGGGGGFGGAIYNKGNLEISFSTMSSNQAIGGGGADSGSSGGSGAGGGSGGGLGGVGTGGAGGINISGTGGHGGNGGFGNGGGGGSQGSSGNGGGGRGGNGGFGGGGGGGGYVYVSANGGSSDFGGGSGSASRPCCGPAHGAGGGGVGLGGAIFNDGGSMMLTGCTFSTNVAQGANGGNATPISGLRSNGAGGGSGYGGTIFNYNGIATLNQCTFSSNSVIAGTGGSGQSSGSNGNAAGSAIYNRQSGGIATVNLNNNTMPADQTIVNTGGGTVTPNCTALVVIPPTLAPVTAGVSYNQAFDASGGNNSYTFTVSGGALPSGLTLSSGGALTGTATPAGTYNFTIRATDSSGCFGEQSLTLTIYASTIVVNTTADTVAADGFCSLREAIQAANTNAAVNECLAGTPGLTTINFDLGAGTPTINLSSTALPAITEPVVIEGNSGDATRVELNGEATNSANGLTLDSGSAGSTVRSLVINRFSYGLALLSSDVTVENCYIGLDAAGLNALANGAGIVCSGSNNTIGGTMAEARNVISGNGEGIRLDSSNGNIIQGNYIGTNAAGTGAIANNTAISCAGSNNTIGGTTAGARNVISGNGNGINITGSASGNKVQSNDIGLNAAGDGALGNGGAAILFTNVSNNTIGGTAEGAGNVIAYNGAGVVMASNASTSTGNQINHNTFYANAGIGIDLKNDGLTANDSGDGDVGPNNLQNFPVLNPITTPGTVTGTLDSTTANTAYPVRLEFFANAACDASGSGEGEVYLGSITLNGPGNFNFTYTLIPGKPFITATATDINGNTSEFSPCAATCPTLTLNPATLPSGVFGSAYSQSFTAAGGTGSYTFTVSSGALPSGLTLSPAGLLSGTATPAGTYNFTIKAADTTGCFGEQALTLTIYASTLVVNTTADTVAVDGFCSLREAIQAANTNAAVNECAPGSPGLTTINFDLGAGTPTIEVSGSALPLITEPVVIDGNTGDATRVELSGAGAAGANGLHLQFSSSGSLLKSLVINRFTWGIALYSDGNAVKDCYVGLDKQGTTALGNQYGVIVNGTNNVIGGTTIEARNVISGNVVGLTIQDGLPDNLVQGNFIGTDAAGTGAVGNTGHGVLLVSPNNTIGGTAPGAGNVIAHNDVFGIFIFAFDWATGNRINGNSIYDNGTNSSLGIDLSGDGITANDPDDADIGPNRLQNYPVLNPIVTPGTVTGALDSTTDNTAYPVRLEFFANSACQASGNGEGEEYLGFLELAAPGSFTFNFTPVAGKAVLTATATDNGGNTSEFSPCAVTCPTLTLNPATLPDGVLGSTYEQIFTAAGGAGPYTFSLSGVVPGLTFNSATATLSGTATQAGSFPLTVSVNDSACSGQRSYALNVGLLNLQATGGEGYVDLSWTHSGFAQISTFKLYRAASNTGPFTLVHQAADGLNHRDTPIPPNTQYFYKLTIVQPDGMESSFSNLAAATPLDVAPPVITHSSVTSPLPANVAIPITATVTDDTGVQSVTLFYRTTGAYSELALAASGNLYAATIPANQVAAPSVDYYLEASDGVSVTRSGQADNPHRITILDRPFIDSVNPNGGPAAGGTAVTITGRNFKANPVVTFDGGIATISSATATQLVCTTPPHFPATVDVRVLNADGASDAKVGGFIYQGTGGALSLPDTGGPQNVRVQIPVNAASVQGMAAADVRITFNSTVLNAVSAATGTLTSGWSLQSNVAIPGEVRLSLASAGGTVTGSGTLAIISFDVPGAPGSTSPLTLASVALNGSPLSASTTDGVFTVAPVYSISGTVRQWLTNSSLANVALALTGDRSYPVVTSQANGTYSVSNVLGGNYVLTPSKSDDVAGISALDAAEALKHAAGVITLSGPANTAADVDRSGSINALDAFYILRQRVGLIGLPFPGAGQVWQFDPATLPYTNLNADQTGQDFTAILLGDVNGSSTGGNAPVTLATLALPTVSVPNDAELSLPLTLHLPSGALFGAELRIVYDPAVLTVLGVEGSALTTNWLRAVNLTTPGLVRIALAHSEGLTGNGELLRLRALTHGPVGNATALTITQARLNEGSIGTTLNAGSVTIRRRAVISDFDLDGQSDLAVWRGSTGDWLVLRSTNGALQSFKWGTSNAPFEDLIVPADYDGDGQADVAVWRTFDGGWYIRQSSDGQTRTHTWGVRGDVPVPGDYDGDGQADLAVWRPGNGTWYVWRSSDGGFTVEAWGQQGDLAVPGDYDGDGKADLAVWRPGNGTWYVKRSSGGTQVTAWGAGYAPYLDVPVQADYDGDGKTDLAIWRGADSLWYIRKSSDEKPLVQLWGANYAPYHDVPVPGDYDGDGKADIAVWRPAQGTWYVLRSIDGTAQVQTHGQSGDTPVPASGLR